MKRSLDGEDGWSIIGLEGRGVTHEEPRISVFFEASVRVPLLLRFPSRLPPSARQELVETIDLMPAILDLCGLPVSESCQGRGLTAREAVFAENIIPEVITGHGLEMPFVPGEGVGGIRHPDAKMVRTRRWKLNCYPDNGGELYDLENDPGESRNLYTDPAQQGTVREWKDRILDWLITADENDQIARRWLA